MRLNGINIQHPISNLILSGEKTIETRTYSLPEKYINQPLLFIETPGKKGQFKARIVGVIFFSECIQYTNKEAFYADTFKHKVDKNSLWAWKEKPKMGWIIDKVIIFPETFLAPYPRGIIFTTSIKIPTKLLSFL